MSVSATPDFLSVPKYFIKLHRFSFLPSYMGCLATVMHCCVCVHVATADFILIPQILREIFTHIPLHYLESGNMGWQTNNKQNHGASDEVNSSHFFYVRLFSSIHSKASILSLSLPLQRRGYRANAKNCANVHLRNIEELEV